MGAIFRINIIQSENLVNTLKEIKKHKFKVIATSLETEESIYDMEYQKTAIIIGNEANGVSREVLEIADKKVKIPMLRKNRKSKCSSSNRSNALWICKTEIKIMSHLGLFLFHQSTKFDIEYTITLFWSDSYENKKRRYCR